MTSRVSVEVKLDSRQPSLSLPLRYDPHTDVWSVEIAPLSSPRTGVCLLETDGYLYAIGGWDGITASSAVERYAAERKLL